jgi:hypothetical protein
VITLEFGGNSGRGWAGTTGYTWVGVRFVCGVVTVEPEHVGIMIVPGTHDENHTLLISLGHSFKTSVLFEIVGVFGQFLGGVAELISD